MKYWKYMICLFLAVLLFLVIPLCSGQDFRRKAAVTVAGNGMIRLMEQEMEEELESPKVSLTFDDGPSRKYTPLLLDGLKERGIHATFFLMGKNIPGNEDLVERIQDEGHLIGNHTYNHIQLDRVSELTAKEEIEKTSNEIFKITGTYPSYVRPPFGAWRKDLDFSVTMFPVFWEIDTLDWKTKNPDSVSRIVENQIHDGAIILMHDGFETSVEAALRIADELSKEGYDFVTVDQLLVL